MKKFTLCSLNRKLIASFIGAASIAYPIIVYWLGSRVQWSYLVVAIIGLSLIRSILQKHKPTLIISLFMSFMILALSFLSTEIACLLYPALMSISFGAVLTHSLFYPPTLIERLARLKTPHLDESAVLYTRNVTKVWLGFSFFNASLSLGTVLYNDYDLWLLYNSCISYILIGTLFIGELIIRKIVKDRKMEKTSNA